MFVRGPLGNRFVPADAIISFDPNRGQTDSARGGILSRHTSPKRKRGIDCPA
jgi:hypothetical protein